VPIHIEILLPAFCLGMITDEHEDEDEEHKHEHSVNDLKNDRKMSTLKENNEEYEDRKISKILKANSNKEDEDEEVFYVKAKNIIQNGKVHPQDDQFEDAKDEKDETLTTEEIVQFYISAIFMLLVGLSMPSIIKTPEESAAAHRALVELDIPR